MKKERRRTWKSILQTDPCIGRIKQLLKKFTMFNHYFNDYVKFTLILKDKLP